MLSISTHFNASARFVVPFYIATIENIVFCTFIIASLLSVWQVKAQDKTSQVHNLVQQLQSLIVADRRSAAADLKDLGKGAKDAVPALITVLKDQDREIRDSAANALALIATALFDTRSTGSLVHLKAAYETLSTHPNSEVKAQAIFVKRTIDYFESLWWVEARNRSIKAISDHLYVSLAIAAYLLLQLTWQLFFWLRPLSLLKVIISLSKTGEKYKIPKIEIPIPLKTALVLPFFHYRPRLLDAWVRHHLAISRENFAKKQTVAQRKVYVMMPALIDEQMREDISAAALQPTFDKKKVTLLVAGEGGAGKTSLACQMANWAMADEPTQRLCKTHQMLPVLIEANLEPRSEVKDLLVDAVSGGLKELIGEPEPVFEELLLQLLRKRRVLVIVDSLSELDETTRKSVRPTDPNFPVAALLVTSRIDEDLGGASKTLLRPLRLKSDRLSTFIDRYLEQLGKRDLFNDEEFFDACRRLSQIVSDRDITVLIAKMYAEQMIASKEPSAGFQFTERKMPRNLAELMLGYVKRLNDRVKADRQDILKVISVAKIVAWECLKQTCRPTTAKRDDALKALSKETDAEVSLNYLDERLRIVQKAGAYDDLIRFSLDPLAEYLAALYLVERCGKFEDVWKEFFENAEKQPGAPETTKAFLLAVRDCCMEKGAEYDVPEWVSDKLAHLAGLDVEAIKSAHLKQRVKILVGNLKSPDSKDRAIAANELRKIGAEAKEGVSALISALKDQDVNVRRAAVFALDKIRVWTEESVLSLNDALKDQDVEVRRHAISALENSGSVVKEFIPTLADLLRDPDVSVRRSAASALGQFGKEASESVPALVLALGDSDNIVRRFVISTLSKIKPTTKEVVPVLITVLKDRDARVRRFATDLLGQIGSEAKEAIPALIYSVKNDEDEIVRDSAAQALKKIELDATETESAS